MAEPTPASPSTAPPTTRATLSRRAVLGGGLALALFGTSCSSKDDAGSATTTSAPEASSTTVAPATSAPATAPVAPLTGLPIDPAIAGRPALSVKIDNAPQARPQAGLEAADIVYEEVVEGGVVRFMVVFHSKDASVVGPVRSVRPVDANLVGPIHGGFAFSGGSTPFVALISKAPVVLVGIDQATAAYRRRKDRKSPHNLYTDTAALQKAAVAAKAVGPPAALFAYRAAGTPSTGAGAAPASALKVVLGQLTTADWAYDGATKLWVRSTNGTPHVLEDGSRLSFTNVVVLSCEYRDTGVVDASGAQSPEAIVIGGGDAIVLTVGPSGGQHVKGRWAKSSQTEVTRLTDQGGASIALLPGPTWVMLAPTTAPITLT